jgi:hypothetical protein
MGITIHDENVRGVVFHALWTHATQARLLECRDAALQPLEEFAEPAEAVTA